MIQVRIVHSREFIPCDFNSWASLNDELYKMNPHMETIQ